jgi:hypothetical protein
MRGVLFERHCLVVAVCLLAIVSGGCVSRPEIVLSTLPQHAAGLSLDNVSIVDAQYLAGHPLDDVLGALSKTRQEGGAAFRSSSLVHASIGGVWVTGVSGSQLLEVLPDNWGHVTGHTSATIAHKVGRLLEMPPNHLLFAYVSGDIVYMASSDDRGILNQLVASMP